MKARDPTEMTPTAEAVDNYRNRAVHFHPRERALILWDTLTDGETSPINKSDFLQIIEGALRLAAKADRQLLLRTIETAKLPYDCMG